MSLRNVVIGVGIVAVTGYFFLDWKIKKLIQQFRYVKIYPTGIKNFNLKWNGDKPVIGFNLDIKLTNPTEEVFAAKILAVKLKRIIFYDKNNVLLGTAIVNTEAITIPAKGSTTIFGIPIQLQLQTVMSSIANAIQGKFSIDDIRLETIVSILGTEHKI